MESAAMAKCVYCERGVEEVPLLHVQSRNGLTYICPQCLPVLIHHPERLQGKLAGAERLQPHEH
jgi:hypothetical protein